MSEYYDDRDACLSQEEVLEIQEEYRQKRLIESIIGPTLSTLFHLALIALLAYFIEDQFKDEIQEVEITIIDDKPELIIPKVVQPDQVIKDIKVIDPDPTQLTVEIELTTEPDSALENIDDDIPKTDDNVNLETVSDVQVTTSAFTAAFAGSRSAAGRAAMVTRMGGTPEGQRALTDALTWLQKVQNPDGSWGIKNQQAYTGLAVLTFLARGETHMSKRFGQTVKKGIQWLSYDKVDKNHGNGYGHAIKSYAVAEAYAMTNMSLLEDTMNSCIRIIIDGQQECGSYDYKYQLAENERQDLSIAGWNYQALKAAYGAVCEEKGLVPAIYKAVDWLKTHGGANDEGKGFPYNAVRSPVGKKHTMRAVGVLCLQLYGEGAAKEIQDEIGAIAKQDLRNLSFTKPPRESLYGWYYATQAMFQKQGQHWNAWRKVFEKELIANQNPEGYWEYPGSWHGSANDKTTDRVYATTLCSLMLTVYYRYLPSYRTKIIERAAEEQDQKQDEGLDLLKF